MIHQLLFWAKNKYGNTVSGNKNEWKAGTKADMQGWSEQKLKATWACFDEKWKKKKRCAHIRCGK